MEIRDDGDAPDIEGVFADPVVARLRSLHVLDASARVFAGGALAKTRPPLRRLRVHAERWEQGFLWVNRNRASAGGRRAGGAQGAGLAEGGGEVPDGGPGPDRRGLLRGQVTRASASAIANADLGNRPRWVLVHALARIAMPRA